MQLTNNSIHNRLKLNIQRINFNSERILSSTRKSNKMVGNIANTFNFGTGITASGNQISGGFTNQIKLAQIVVPMPVTIPITGAESMLYGSFLPKKHSVDYRPRNLPIVKILLTPQSIRQSMQRYHNPEQANDVLIKNMKEWYDDPTSNKLPALRKSVKSYVMMADAGNQKKTAVIRGNSSTARLRKKGPTPPSNNKPALANLRNQQDQLRFQNIMRSNNIRDLPQRLYRLVADWAEHYSIQRQLKEPLDMINIARTPKSNPLNPTEVSSFDAAMSKSVEDGFVRIHRETSKGIENEYFFKYKTLMRNGQPTTSLLRADELYQKLNTTNPH